MKRILNYMPSDGPPISWWMSLVWHVNTVTPVYIFLLSSFLLNLNGEYPGLTEKQTGALSEAVCVIGVAFSLVLIKADRRAKLLASIAIGGYAILFVLVFIEFAFYP
jgi:hypothetical protein